jgi:hypothetical protein
MLRVVEGDDLGSPVEFLQCTCAGVIQARVAPACRRLRAPNLDARVVPIDVLPLQAADLAGAQAAVEGERRRDVGEDPPGFDLAASNKRFWSSSVTDPCR